MHRAAWPEGANSWLCRGANLLAGLSARGVAGLHSFPSALVRLPDGTGLGGRYHQRQGGL